MSAISVPIQTAARIRALDSKDEKQQTPCIRVSKSNPNEVDIEVADGDVKTFALDSLFGTDKRNADVFNECVLDLTSRVLHGYNAGVIIYGGSQSGKSHTLIGKWSGAENGLLPRAIDKLFAQLTGAQGKGTEYLVTVSAFQIRNRRIIDLLNPKTKTSLELINSKVKDVAELVVESAQSAKTYLKQALRVREVLSSRSREVGKPHTIIDISVESRASANPFMITQAVLRFVEVAGCGGQEAQFNEGLAAMHVCVERLHSMAKSKKKTLNSGRGDDVNDSRALVPFQSSLLTRCLEPFLGGNAVTRFLVFLAPQKRSVADGLHCLQLAEKVRSIPQRAKVNSNTVSVSIRELRTAIKRAREDIASSGQPGQFLHNVDPRKIRRLQLLVDSLQAVKARTWEKKRDRSTRVLSERKEQLNREGLLAVLADTDEDESPSERNTTARRMLQKVVLAIDDISMKESQIEKLSAPASADPKSEESKMHRRLERDLGELRGRLAKMEQEYEKTLRDVIDEESKSKRKFLLAKDTSYVRRAEQLHKFSNMHSQMRRDRVLQDKIQDLERKQEKAMAVLRNKDSSTYPTLLEKNSQAILSLLRNKEELTWQKNQLWGMLIEQGFRHKVQLQRYQEHMFFIFRNYRSHFAEQRQRMDERYRALVENSVKDALRLHEENVKLRALLAEKNRQ